MLPAPPPALIAAAPTPHTLTGDIRAHSLAGRTVLVRLPAGYDAPRNRTRRYPVLYLQDGQNVFDGATAFIPGAEWRADETAAELEARGEITPLIIVAVYNAGGDRLREYTPVPDAKYGGGGADEYGAWLRDVGKAFVDRTYRTQKGAAHSAVGGSSLGALLALHESLAHPDVWGGAAVLSPSVWWADKAILREVRALPRRPAVRLYVSIGGTEDDSGAALTGARDLREALHQAGWRVGGDLFYAEAPGAKHNEAAWAARFGDVLRFLFPAAPSP